jgi:hypothetical protein
MSTAFHPTTARPHGLLPRALRLNAAFSAVTGAGAVAGAGVLSDPLGPPAPLLVAVGVGLLGYAALLWRGSATVPVDPALARVAIAADTAWVVGAAALLLAWPDAMTSTGRWSLGLLTLGVADFAVAQAVGLRRQARA